MREPIPLGRNLLLLERVAVGGMAEVYRAKAFGARGFERILAVKRILPAMAEDPEFVRMFVDEARLASSLNHQNIVQIYDFSEIDRVQFLSMEYVAGRDLRTILDRLKKQKELLEPPMAAAIVARVAEALDYAHRKREPAGKDANIIHRDVSPQNVLISYEGEVKLCDFGIAKAATQSTRTQVGVLKGKFAYMSPEQVRGRTIDRRSDLFALGVIFYEMLTGERIFVGESDYATLENVRHAKVPLLRQVRATVPPKLEEICLRMLAREPQDRYQWASDILDDLTKYSAGVGKIVHAHHLRQWVRQAYAAELALEEAKLAEFAPLKMPAEGARPVSSVLDELGLGSLLGSDRHLVAPVAGTPKPTRHDDMSATVAADEDDETGRVEGATLASDEAAPSRAAEIQAAQAALLEGLSKRPSGEAMLVEKTSETPMPHAPEVATGPVRVSQPPRPSGEPSLRPVRERASQPPRVEERAPTPTRPEAPAPAPSLAPPAAAFEGPPPMAPTRGAERSILAGAALLVAAAVALLLFLVLGQRPTSASLLIETVPTGAVEVRLDGQPIGSQTPIEVEALALGEHTVELSAAGYAPYKQTFSILEKRPHTLSIPLEQLTEGAPHDGSR